MILRQDTLVSRLNEDLQSLQLEQQNSPHIVDRGGPLVGLYLVHARDYGLLLIMPL